MFPMLVHLEDKRLKVRGRLMCALCPSKFEDDEEIRLHPRCSHIFYFDCFDTWVTSHISCPICRANLVDIHFPTPIPRSPISSSVATSIFPANICSPHRSTPRSSDQKALGASPPFWPPPALVVSVSVLGPRCG
ncbi:hypothetical protein OPV22_002734 [Ensete ventricosum]|uniref:RING-type E3 ubiquitin transferase n=1 Tax=Ensete ventricosum TaxID=4639 RepID=A0AAV8RYU7_ENSVE|nr:hypothetical protein OPV22_002734 [Ensete ventricosum]